MVRGVRRRRLGSTDRGRCPGGQTRPSDRSSRRRLRGRPLHAVVRHFAASPFWFHYRQLPAAVQTLADKTLLCCARIRITHHYDFSPWLARSGRCASGCITGRWHGSGRRDSSGFGSVTTRFTTRFCARHPDSWQTASPPGKFPGIIGQNFSLTPPLHRLVCQRLFRRRTGEKIPVESDAVHPLDRGTFSLFCPVEDGGRREPGSPVRVAHIAQLVEHVLGKDEVIGSIPIVGWPDPVSNRRRTSTTQTI